MLVTQSCPALWDSMDCSPPGSSVHGTLQARILEWVAISFSRGSSWPRDWTPISHIVRQILYHLSHGKAQSGSFKSLSCVQLFGTPWTVAYQAPLSMELSRQEYWSGWPFPSPGDLPDPGIEPGSPALQADSWPYGKLKSCYIIKLDCKSLRIIH